MNVLQNIYDNSPVFFQHIMTSVKGYQNTKNRFGRIYYEHREFLRDFDNWTLERKCEYQRKELIKFVRYAYENSSFYHELYKDIDIYSIENIDDLKKLPIVDKEMLRSSIEDVYTVNKKDALEGHTGGTTGKSYGNAGSF